MDCIESVVGWVVEGERGAYTIYEPTDAMVERGRVALNERVDEPTLRRAAEGKPDAEEAVVREILAAVFGQERES